AAQAPTLGPPASGAPSSAGMAPGVRGLRIERAGALPRTQLVEVDVGEDAEEEQREEAPERPEGEDPGDDRRTDRDLAGGLEAEHLLGDVAPVERPDGQEVDDRPPEADEPD